MARVAEGAASLQLHHENPPPPHPGGGDFFAEIQYVKFGTQKRKKCANHGLLWVLDKNIDFEPMVLARRRRA
jgi:hypothetical protein